MMKITLQGIEAATRSLANMQGWFKKADRVRVFVGSNLVYAYGIEFGRTKSGKMARRAGGAFMLRDALASVMPSIADIVRAELTADNFDFGAALYKVGLRLQNIAMGQTPVRTGSLRRSMHTLREG